MSAQVTNFPCCPGKWAISSRSKTATVLMYNMQTINFVLKRAPTSNSALGLIKLWVVSASAVKLSVSISTTGNYSSLFFVGWISDSELRGFQGTGTRHSPWIRTGSCSDTCAWSFHKQPLTFFLLLLHRWTWCTFWHFLFAESYHQAYILCWA